MYGLRGGNYGDEFRGEVIVDTDGHIVVASWTESTDFPSRGGNSGSFHGGTTDGILFKMSQGLNTMIWSKFIGGDGNDLLFSVKQRPAGYFVTGNSTSRDIGFPETTDFALFQKKNGTSTSGYESVDGFVAFINRRTLELERGAFLGTDEFDASFLLDIDEESNIYVVGQTRGDYTIVNPKEDPSGENIYRDDGGGVFIHAFSPDLSTTLWTTTIGTGGRPNFSPTAFLVNACGQISLTGWGGRRNRASAWYNGGGGTKGLRITEDAVQRDTDGNDFYLIVLEKNALGEPIYATHLGGDKTDEHVDGGTSRFDKTGIVHAAVCSCHGDDFPTTSNAFSSKLPTDKCNLAFFKFDLSKLVAHFVTDNEEGTQPGFSSGCAPLTVAFDRSKTVAEEVTWDFGDGRGFVKVGQLRFTHTFTKPGEYEVVMRAHNTESCIAVKETRVLITVLDEPVSFSEDQSICTGESVQLYASGGATYAWEPPLGLSSTSIANPVANPPEPTTYNVTVRTPGGCVVNDNVRVEVFEEVTLAWSYAPVGNPCLGSRHVSFTASAPGASTIPLDLRRRKQPRRRVF